MTDDSAQFYRIEASFYNEGEQYGMDVFYVEADSLRAAEGLGREAATQSKYDDDRIPDRSVHIEAEQIEQDDIPDGELVYRLWLSATP